MTMHHRISSVSARALAFGLSAGLALLPTTGWAAPEPAPPPAEVTAPGPEAPAEPTTEPTEPTVPTDVAQPEPTEPTAPTDVAQPEPTDVAQPEPEPEPKPEPKVTTPPAPTPTPPVDDGSVVDPRRARALRVGGLGTLIVGGGVAVTGLALGIAFTVRGKAQQQRSKDVEDQLALNDCVTEDSATCDANRAELDDINGKIDAANGGARLGGILMLAGAVAIVTGGVIHRRGVRMEEKLNARIRLSPTLGGAVLSGRF